MSFFTYIFSRCFECKYTTKTKIHPYSPPPPQQGISLQSIDLNTSMTHIENEEENVYIHNFWDEDEYSDDYVEMIASGNQRGFYDFSILGDYEFEIR